MKRFIIEFGIGVDFHGQDVNRAAEKAIQEAISRSCLCGLKEILNIENLDDNVEIKATIAVSNPEKIDIERMKRCFPIGRKQINPVKGGLKVSGLFISEFGDQDDSIEVALVCVEVGVFN
ncbi:Lin0512 family protein [Tissierella sp. MSJ-40]|uniref:Lin0512 family protein n=1 Tax=Tissierella simiarum TaxID=2841534 RepID=A0ABS6E3E1_9FIRM|nr:Lin0512 family protein [Tissierella simiarum]